MSNKDLALLGLVLSIVTGGLPGLIVSAVALKKMKDAGEEDGKGMAIAGLVIGIIEIASVVITLVTCVGAAGCTMCFALAEMQ